MGIQLNQRTQAFGVEDQSWVAPAGADAFDENRQSIMLNGAAFGAVFTNGVVPSGCVLAQVGGTAAFAQVASGAWVPYNPAGSGGRQFPQGFLCETTFLNQPFTLGDPTTTYFDTGGNLWFEGAVVTSILQAKIASGLGSLDTNAIGLMVARFHFVPTL
jgi:hypothetical protein